MIASRLSECVGRLKEIAGGDLAGEPMQIKVKDEIGELGVAINGMLENLRNIVYTVSKSAERVAVSSRTLSDSAEQSSQAADRIASTITDIAKGSESQLSAVNETTAVIEQISSGIQLVAVNADNVASTSEKTYHAAQNGEKAVNEVIKQMSHIESTVTNSAEVIRQLGTRSKEIGSIVDTISGIAGQTNLLALNAAIEAARAGEQGQGFSVVAEEVRKLAEQSEEAAKQIAVLIQAILTDTDRAVVAMNEGTKEVKIGSEVVNSANQSFKEIGNLIKEVSSQVREISSAIQQIAANSKQIVNSMQNINQTSKEATGQTQTVSAATEEQLASMEEMVSLGQNLSNMAEELQNLIRRFKIK